jgi:hypothetical protein
LHRTLAMKFRIVPEESKMDVRKLRALGQQTSLFLLFAFLGTYPALAAVFQRRISGIFSFFAADAFYYLKVATVSANLKFYSFDGSNVTNGFHPLWQYYLTYSFRFLDLCTQESQIYWAFFSCLVLAAIGLGFLGLAVTNRLGSLWAALFVMTPGAYYLLFGLVDPNFGATWSFVNGMESGLSIFFFGALLYLLSLYGESYSKSLVLKLSVSAILVLITLSRLDDIFIFAPFILQLLFSRGSLRKRVSDALLFVTIPTVFVGTYTLYNRVTAGSALPISGAAKAGYALRDNARLIWSTLFPSGPLFSRRIADYWQETGFRALQVCAPAVAAGAFLFHSWKQRETAANLFSFDSLPSITRPFAAYVLLKAFYNLVNVNFWHQGHWYFPLSILTFNLICASYINWRNSLVSTFRGVSFLAVLVVLVVANGFWANKLRREYNQEYFDFWDARHETVKALTRAYPDGGLLEFDDGILSYALGMPGMSGLGFALDVKASRAKERGDLLTIAYERGFRVLGSLVYMPPERVRRRLRQPMLVLPDYDDLLDHLRHVFFLNGQDLSKWEFRRIESVTSMTLIEFKPK